MKRNKTECMRRALLISGLALCLAACGNSGNQSGKSDSSAIPPGNTGRDSYGADSGPGTGTGPGTGAAPVGENTQESRNGTLGDSASNGRKVDTTRRNRQ